MAKKDNPNYDGYRLYLENESLLDYFKLSAEEYIAVEYLYNLTSKDTKMLDNGLSGSIGFNKIKKYLLKYLDIHIPDIKDTKSKVNFTYNLYDGLCKKGVLSYIGPYTYIDPYTGHKEQRRLYEFTDEARTARLTSPKKEEDTYIKETTVFTTKLF